MAAVAQVSSLSQYVLARVLTARHGSISLTELSKSITPFLSREESNQRLATSIEELAGLSLVQVQQAGRSRQARICDHAKSDVFQILGLRENESVRWKEVQERRLLAMAMGRANDDDKFQASISNSDGLRAALIISHFKLDLPSTTSLRKVVDAVAWRELGVNETRSISSGAVLSLLLGRSLGADDRIDITWRTRAAQLACQATGARNTSIREVRRAILAKWLAVPGEPSADEKPRLDDFVDLVRDIAKRTKTGRFGDNKVFISHVWRAYRDQSLKSPITEAQFKECLINAYKAKKLLLSRADLPQLMNENDVRESATKYGDFEFHFIVIDGV